MPDDRVVILDPDFDLDARTVGTTISPGFRVDIGRKAVLKDASYRRMQNRGVKVKAGSPCYPVVVGIDGHEIAGFVLSDFSCCWIDTTADNAFVAEFARRIAAGGDLDCFHSTIDTLVGLRQTSKGEAEGDAGAAKLAKAEAKRQRKADQLAKRMAIA